MYLNCHTYYSYKFGTLKPEQLLALAAGLGLKKMAHTDINNTSASMEMLRLSPKAGVEVVLGVDFRNKADQLFVCLAQNQKGFKEINDYLSPFLTTDNPLIPAIAPPFEQVYVIYPWEKYIGQPLRNNEFVGVRPEQLTKLSLSRNDRLMRKMVVLQTVTFRNKSDFNSHRLLRSIDNNLLLSKLPLSEEGKPHHVFLPPNEMESRYADFPQILHNTEALMEGCEPISTTDHGKNKNLKTYTGSAQGDMELVKTLYTEGLAYRFNNQITDVITQRLEKEVDIVSRMGFISYFLINWDVLKYARQKGYFYVGRGSGANSLLAYLLRITDVDPIELDLYFERFINLYRSSPPDFDLDFSWLDRDDMTDYIFGRFPNTALLATYQTFQYRAVVRELGKVFGLPKAEIDTLSDGKFDPTKLDHISGLVLKYGQKIQDFPSHLSIHAGGILIAEQSIHHYSSTFLPPKGFPTTQFDMVVAEDIGLYKFDILSQRGLGKIKDAVDIIHRNNPADPIVDIHNIPVIKRDNKVKELLMDGRAMGCFYVESPAMRMLLKKLKVEDYLTLVAASSIIRPGVARSGMMREYILRYRFPERRKDAHPVMLDIMPDTFGVMVYQEDVIKVAHYFAGLTLAEADVLRRGMSGKFGRSRDEFDQIKNKFFENCYEKGYPQALSSEVWRQIESFAGYAFAKGHSASYAVESYQSLYLKAYYPLEYMVAVINNFGGFYATEFYVHEARMLGAAIHPPCVNNSLVETTIYANDVYIGFMHIQHLETKIANQIVHERVQAGPYEDFDDFIDRVAITLDQVSILIKIDAFRFSGKSKRALLWEAYFKLNKGNAPDQVQAQLFKPQYKQFNLPMLHHQPLEDAFDQIELLGFPLVDPFSLLTQSPSTAIQSRDFERLNGKTITISGYMVSVKHTRTIKGDTMYFGTFIDREGYFFDTTHFPPVAKKYPFLGRGVYEITGKVAEEFGFYSLEVESQHKLKMMEDPRYFDGKHS